MIEINGEKVELASKYYRMALDRFLKEQPERILTVEEKDGIWWELYGRVLRGQPENEIIERIQTADISKKGDKKYRGYV